MPVPSPTFPVVTMMRFWPAGLAPFTVLPKEIVPPPVLIMLVEEASVTGPVYVCPPPVWIVPFVVVAPPPSLSAPEMFTPVKVSAAVPPCTVLKPECVSVWPPEA